MTNAQNSGAVELLPCPICGEQPRWRGTRSDYVRGIYRLQCLGETHLFQSYGPDEAKAIENWNTRATPAPSDQAGWQDIASMPLWEVGVVTDGYRADCAQKAQGDHDEEGEFYFAVDPEDGLEWEPTHWMSLPTAPTLTAGEGGVS